MKWLIAIGVLGFMLAPLIWIIPTPRQAHQAKLRECARQQGLKVSVQALPQTRRQKVRREPEIQGLCYSLLLGKRAVPDDWTYWFDGAAYQDDDVPLPAETVLTAIAHYQGDWPQDATMLRYSGRALQFFWRERRADVATVERLGNALRNLKQELNLER